MAAGGQCLMAAAGQILVATHIEGSTHRWTTHPIPPGNNLPGRTSSMSSAVSGTVRSVTLGGGHLTLSHRPPEEAGPVLKRYVAVATATRPYFQADKDAPVEKFVAEVDRHPCSSSSR